MKLRHKEPEKRKNIEAQVQEKRKIVERESWKLDM
jgi:hypothetical protein